MIRVLVFLCFAFDSFAELKPYSIEGTGFPSEDIFIKKTRQDYDFILEKITFPDKDKIKLEGQFGPRFIGAGPWPPNKYETNFPKINSLFSPNAIKYMDWGIPSAFLLYGVFSWKWGENGFRFIDEGWFGKNTYAGGADKLAHAYSHYLISRSSYFIYRNAGMEASQALMRSTVLAATVGILIEIGDGISHYGFSINDIICDAAGISLGYLLNSHAYLDELIGFQIYWWNHSSDPRRKDRKFKDPIDDYNNQKYILNFRLAAIPYLREFFPTRYLNLDLGYYSRGYKTKYAETAQSSRKAYFGVSINFSQILTDFFPDNNFSYYSSKVLRYYQPHHTGFELLGGKDSD